MSKVCFYLSAVIILALSPLWSAIAATGFKDDTSECRNLLDSQNYTKAVSICTQDAEAGDSAAQFNLSLMYSSGWGVSKNDAEALKWLRASADQRYPPAQYTLASHYGAGTGVLKDSKEAVRLLLDAAEQGFVLAQMQLGSMYERGYQRLEIKPEISVAINWYRQAAVQCDACQVELWRIYYFGLGVDKDYVEAARHLKKAADAGLPQAQMQLAFRYLEGEGVPKDNVHAYKWFYIAEKAGEPRAKRALPLLSRNMSRSEIAEAKTLADETTAKFVINTNLLCALYNQFCGK